MAATSSSSEAAANIESNIGSTLPTTADRNQQLNPYLWMKLRL
jgi:hypothetical protein